MELHALFGHQRLEIQRQLVEICRLRFCDPWDVFVLLLDLRAEFGRQVALHLRTQEQIDRGIREAEALGEPAGFSLPVDIERGLEIVDLFVPSLREQVVARPARTVAALVVDEHDYPCIAYIRLLDPKVALS